MIKQFTIFSLIIISLNCFYSYNEKHINILLDDITCASWEKWRKKFPHIKPDLSSVNLINRHLWGNFFHVNLRHSKISFVSISAAQFINSDLSYAIINYLNVLSHTNRDRTFFENASFFRSQINNSKTHSSCFINVNFNEAIISKTKIEYGIIRKTNFIKANINNTEIFGELHDSDFSYSKIIKSIIISGFNKNTIINNVKFNNATVHYSFIVGWIYNVNFINADLNGTSFLYYKLPEGSTLTNVNFTNANLTNVNFQKAKFHNVILKNADMTGAKLERKWYSYVKKQGVRNFDKINWQ